MGVELVPPRGGRGGGRTLPHKRDCWRVVLKTGQSTRQVPPSSGPSLPDVPRKPLIRLRQCTAVPSIAENSRLQAPVPQSKSRTFSILKYCRAQEGQEGERGARRGTNKRSSSNQNSSFAPPGVRHKIKNSRNRNSGSASPGVRSLSRHIRDDTTESVSHPRASTLVSLLYCAST